VKRVTLIVTGDLEKKALHLSLERLFPETQLEVLQLDGFTSCELPPEPVFEPERLTLVEKLADALIGAVDPGRTGTPSDLAFLVDDLELYSVAVPERAVHHVRAAVLARLRVPWSNEKRREQCARIVRERCSFHLLSPMVEAYFFGEPGALVRAGAKRPARIDPHLRDVEDFVVTDDEGYLAPPDGEHPAWAIPSRARHPKSYLRFLCDPDGTIPRAYRETKGGHEALRSLDWRAVLAPEAHVRFARAFLTDLAEGLDHPQASKLFAGTSHPLTSRSARDNVLRNV
jgi:hypothetical protein